MMPLDVVGAAEVARMMQVHPTTVSRWRAAGEMPPAEARLLAGPVWRTKTIKKWAAATGRSWTQTCVLCGQALAEPWDTVLVTDRPTSVAHMGCAADHAMELEDV